MPFGQSLSHITSCIQPRCDGPCAKSEGRGLASLCFLAVTPPVNINQEPIPRVPCNPEKRHQFWAKCNDPGHLPALARTQMTDQAMLRQAQKKSSPAFIWQGKPGKHTH